MKYILFKYIYIKNWTGATNISYEFNFYVSKKYVKYMIVINILLQDMYICFDK